METAEHFWYLSAASQFPGCSLLLATLLPYTSCSRTAIEMLKLSTRAEGIFTFFFLVLSHHTQLFLANVLWSLGSVYNMRDLLSEYQCCYLIVLFGVCILACSHPVYTVEGLYNTGKGNFYQ